MSDTRNTSRTSYLASLRSKVKEMSSPKGFQETKRNDERYWKPEQDKLGNGSAVIRFLPAKLGEEYPFVQFWSHGFNGPTEKLFLDNCPSSLGGIPSEVCPVCKVNNELWNASKDKEDPRKKIAQDRKRKLHYISNILVVNDPKHPENNGKVFLFKYGVKIFDKIKDLIDPSDEFGDNSVVPIDPFSMEEGANFRLRVVRVDRYPNYDKSTFDAPTAIGNEDFIANVETQLHSLKEFLDPKNFKDYATLEKRFNYIVGDDAKGKAEAATAVNKPSLEEPARPSARTQTQAPAPAARPAVAPVAAAPITKDEDQDYFEKLAQG